MNGILSCLAVYLDGNSKLNLYDRIFLVQVRKDGEDEGDSITATYTVKDHEKQTNY